MSFRPRSYCGAILTIEDLRQRCYVDDITNCWHWRGARDANDSPSVHCRAINDRTSLGVLIGVLKTGQRPAKGVRWFSTCETRNCANPAHRKAGTPSEALKGRTGPRTQLQRDKIALGRRTRDSKLTAELAAEIRLSEESSRALAVKYGIAQSTAARVKSGKCWRPIGGSSVFSWRPA